jgi:type I restriction enzyme S subunit
MTASVDRDDIVTKPEGWAVVPFIEAVTLQRGFDLPVQDREAGTVPIYAANGPVGTHNIARVKGPGVVTGRSGTIGKVHFVPTDFWPLNTSLYVRDFHGNDPKFVALLLNALGLERYLAGTGVPTLNRNIVHEVAITVPPLREQQRIVAKVENLNRYVEAARSHLSRVPAILKRFRQSVLTAACSGRLTEDWRLSRALSNNSNRIVSERWSDEPLPNRWSLTTVGEIGSVQGGKRLPKGTLYASQPTAHPYIRVTDFRNMSVSDEDLRYIDEATHSAIKRYTISDSDLYISIAGTIGKVGLVPHHLSGANLTENAAKITSLQNARRAYLSYALNSKPAQDQIEEYITSSGQPKLCTLPNREAGRPIAKCRGTGRNRQKDRMSPSTC